MTEQELKDNMVAEMIEDVFHLPQRFQGWDSWLNEICDVLVRKGWRKVK